MPSEQNKRDRDAPNAAEVRETLQRLIRLLAEKVVERLKQEQTGRDRTLLTKS